MGVYVERELDCTSPCPFQHVPVLVESVAMSSHLVHLVLYFFQIHHLSSSLFPWTLYSVHQVHWCQCRDQPPHPLLLAMCSCGHECCLQLMENPGQNGELSVKDVHMTQMRRTDVVCCRVARIISEQDWTTAHIYTRSLYECHLHVEYWHNTMITTVHKGNHAGLPSGTPKYLNWRQTRMKWWILVFFLQNQLQD